jgi:predicted permease
VREQNRVAHVETVWQDLRYAVRSLRRQPGFTFTALLMLILAIGLNTTLFTSINTVLLRPWAVPDPGRMAKVFVDGGGSSILFQRYLSAHSSTLQGVMFYRAFNVSLGNGPGQEAIANAVSANYFDALGVHMRAGRGFLPQEDRGESGVAVLSHGAWTRRYGADETIVGRRIAIDEVRLTVIGVAPADFLGTTGSPTDVWLPPGAFRSIRPREAGVNEMLTNPDWCCVELAARLKAGVAREQARSEIEVLYRQFLESNGIPLRAPGNRRRGEIAVASTAQIPPSRRQRALSIFALLVAAIGSVLLLACANVGNLQLARAVARHREMAVRIAIGAGRARLARQLLTESLLLSATASAGGLAIAFALPRFMLRLLGGEAALSNLQWTPDWAVLVYSIAIAAASAVGFGLAPALSCTRISAAEAMKRQSAALTSRSRLRGFLIGSQIAISIALLATASSLVRSLLDTQNLDPGFRTAGLTALRVSLPANSYDPNRTYAFQELFIERSGSAQPLGITLAPPLTGSRRAEFRVPGRSSPPSVTIAHWVNADFLDILRIPLLAGRNFSPEDLPRSAVLINETLAAREWPAENPLGRTVLVDGEPRQVRGIVRDSQISGIGPVPATLFVPVTGNPTAGVTWFLIPDPVAARSIEILRQLEPRASVTATKLPDLLYTSFGGLRTSAQLVTALAMLGLLLAVYGVWGTVCYSVEQRRQEIGIRMVLGATPRQAAWTVLRAYVPPCGIGLVAGTLLAIVGTRIIESQFYGVGRFHPWAYGGKLALLVFVGVMASLLPAYRAARNETLSTISHP